METIKKYVKMAKDNKMIVMGIVIAIIIIITLVK